MKISGRIGHFYKPEKLRHVIDPTELYWRRNISTRSGTQEIWPTHEVPAFGPSKGRRQDQVRTVVTATEADSHLENNLLSNSPIVAGD